jgi:hypothetical protein
MLAALAGAEVAAPVAIVAMLVGALVPTVYSYVVARHEA